MIKKFFELLRTIWLSFKKALSEILHEDVETPHPPENQVGEQPKTQQPQIQEPQREVVRPVSLGIASTDAPKYRKNKSLLTKPEHILYQALLHASDNKFMVFAKVRMGDFVFLANEPHDRKFHVNQVLCKHVDFLLCDNQTLEPLLVIELDDSSHKQYEQSERDEFKNRTFLAIGLPYLRIALQQEYDWKSLQTQIKEKLGQKMN
jgi:very-short-patch-repair endonuclease